MVKAMNIALGIGIAIVLVLVVVLGVETFYPSPEYEDFCEYDYEDFSVMENESSCLAMGGKWNPKVDATLESERLEITSRCDGSIYTRNCDDQVNEAREPHSKVLFFVINIIGVLFIVVSLFLMGMPNISSGIAFSGIALFVYGFIRGWQGTEDVWKFSTGVVIAGLLIWFAVMVNRKYEGK